MREGQVKLRSYEKKLKKAHAELYNCMLEKHMKKEPFTKEDMLHIHMRHTETNKYFDKDKMTPEQIYANASKWLNGAIATLVRRGYLGLTFRKGMMEYNEETKQFEPGEPLLDTEIYGTSEEEIKEIIKCQIEPQEQ